MIFGDDEPMSDPLPSSPIAKAVQRKAKVQVKEEEEDDDIMDVAPAVGQEGRTTASVNMKGSRPPPKIKPTSLPSPVSSSPPPTVADTEAATWTNVTSKLAIASSPANDTQTFGKMKPQDAIEEDGSLRFFWLDYTEVNGNLCLFGKVKHKGTGQYQSAFVKVDNILRTVYFLPRQYKYPQWS